MKNYNLEKAREKVNILYADHLIDILEIDDPEFREHLITLLMNKQTNVGIDKILTLLTPLAGDRITIDVLFDTYKSKLLIKEIIMDGVDNCDAEMDISDEIYKMVKWINQKEEWNTRE